MIKLYIKLRIFWKIYWIWDYFWHNTKKNRKGKRLMTKHIQWTDNSHKKDLIFLKERVAVSSALPKLAIPSWPVTRLVWNGSSKPKNVTATNQVWSLGKHGWTCALAQLNPGNWSFLPKTLGWRYLACCILPWREDALCKIVSLGDATKNSWQTFVELHALSSNLVKLVEQIAKDRGKKKAKMVYALQPTLPVKETAGRLKESVSVSKVLWTWSSKPMIM